MSVYGFRIHVVSAHPARKRKELEFHGSEFADPMGTLLHQASLVDGQTFVRDGTYNPDATAAGATVPARTPVLRVDRSRRVGDAVEFELSYGRTGEHAFVISTDGAPDLSLDNAAPGRHYNCVLYLPKAGERALLVSEVKGRTFAGAMLLKRLSVEHFLEAHRSPDEDAWVRWTVATMFDEARVDEVITEGSLEGLRLIRSSTTMAGGRKSRAITLTQDGVPASKVQMARDLVKSWLRRGSGGAAKPQDIDSMVAMVDGDVSGVGFTDGVLTFEENGKAQPVSPSKLEKIQVYPIGPDRPTLSQLRSVAEPRLRHLAAVEGIPIDL